MEISSSEESEGSSTTDENLELSYYEKNKELPEPNIQNPKKIRLQNTARVADLTGSSNRTVAKLVNAVFEDLNVISTENPSKVVDKNKIRRALHTSRHRQQEQNLVNNSTIDGLYFDGRKDQTYSRENDRCIIIQQEHISVIQEPGSNYFCHVSLKPPVSAVNIKNGLLECLNKYKTNIDTLTVIGCDGTNVNTGWKGGAIRLLETHLNRPLQ